MAAIRELLLFLVLIGIACGVIFFVYNFRIRRAIRKVIEIFYEHHALGMRDAKTLRELGLERSDFLRRMMKTRDFKQYALQVLMKRGVIHSTEDGKLYLVEDKLGQEVGYPRKGSGPEKL